MLHNGCKKRFFGKSGVTWFTLLAQPCLYTATYTLSQYGDMNWISIAMDTKIMDTPLSQSSVSLKLEEIQKRCNRLMDEPEALLELSLEDPSAIPRANDPYNFHRS